MIFIDKCIYYCLFTGIGLIASEIYCYRMKYKNKSKRLATSYIGNIHSIDEYLSDNGLIINNKIILNSKYTYEGSCIIGPNGSGKSSSFFFTNLLSNTIKGSIIVTDPKGELFEKTAYYQKHICKREVYRFSPLDNSKEKYNLLDNCTSSTDIDNLASCILINGNIGISNNTEWINMSKPLLVSVLLYCKNTKNNTIQYALEILNNFTIEDIEKIISDSNNEESIRYFNIFKVVTGSKRTESSILITLLTSLQLFANKELLNNTYTSNFDIKQFRYTNSILYIQYNENKSEYLSPFMSSFFTQILDILKDEYDVNNNVLPITFLFDEFSNIGKLNNLSQNISTFRSRKLSFNIGIQSISQLQQLYGNYITNSVLNNLKTKIILPGISDINTLNYISSISGENEVIVENTNRKYDVTKSSYSNSYNINRKKLLENGEIRCLENNKGLLIINNKQPVIINVHRYYLYKKYTNNINKFKSTYKCSKNISYKNDIEKLKELYSNNNNEFDIEDILNDEL